MIILDLFNTSRVGVFEEIFYFDTIGVYIPSKDLHTCKITQVSICYYDGIDPNNDLRTQRFSQYKSLTSITILM